MKNIAALIFAMGLIISAQIISSGLGKMGDGLSFIASAIRDSDSTVSVKFDTRMEPLNVKMEGK